MRVSDSVKTGPEKAPHRSLWKAMGLTNEELTRPLIGVVSAQSECVPGHMHLGNIAQAVKDGVRMAGGVPVDGKLYPTGANATVLGNLNGLARTDAAFLGWSLTQTALLTTYEQELATAILSAGDVMAMIDGGILLYAVWATDGNGNNIPDYREVSVAGRKTWIDGDNDYLTRPLEITINLLRNGQAYATQQVRANPNGEWLYSFDGLPKYDLNGGEYTYSITEDQVPGYRAPEYDGYNVTNRIAQDTISYTVNKTWVDNPAATHPTITVTLYQNGIYMASAQMANGTLQHTFTDLPMYNSTTGERYVYTVTEDEVAGYDTAIVGGSIYNYVVDADEPEDRARTLTIEEMAVPLGFGGTIMNVGDCFE